MVFEDQSSNVKRVGNFCAIDSPSAVGDFKSLFCVNKGAGGAGAKEYVVTLNNQYVSLR